MEAISEIGRRLRTRARGSRPCGTTLVLALIALWAVADVVFLVYINGWHTWNRPFHSMFPLWQNAYYHLVYGTFVAVPATANLWLARRHLGFDSALGRWVVPATLAPVAWGIGNLVWFWFVTCTAWPAMSCAHDIAIPYPSFSDLFYLLLYPIAFASGLVFVRILGVTLRDMLRVSWLMIPAALLSVHIMVPATHIGGMKFGLATVFGPSSDATSAATSVTYLVGDLAVLAITLVLVSGAIRLRQAVLVRPLAVLAAGYVALYAADSTFFVRVANGTYHGGDISDALYSAAMLLPTLAVTLLLRSVGGSSHTRVLPAGSLDYEEVAAVVLDVHERLLGPTVRQVAATVPGLQVARDGSLQFHAPARAVSMRLVRALRKLSGELGMKACETALAAQLEASPDLAAWFADASAGRAEHSDRYRIANTVAAPACAVAAAAAAWGSGEKDVVLICGAVSFLLVGQWTARVRLQRRAAQLADVSQSLASLVDSLDQARMEERHRIAADIHDFAMQQLVAAIMQLERAREAAGQDGRDDATIVRAEELVRDSLDALRRVLRGIDPVSLYYFDLLAALDQFRGDFHASYAATLTCEVGVLPVLPASTSLVLYRLIVEAARNAGRHAAATEVRVTLRVADGTIVAEVRDDGCGFPHPVSATEPLETSGGWGLRLIAEQTRMLGGTMLLSSMPGRGTTLRVIVPVPDADVAAASTAPANAQPVRLAPTTP